MPSNVLRGELGSSPYKPFIRVLNIRVRSILRECEAPPNSYYGGE
jgi:hypothetical protein